MNMTSHKFPDLTLSSVVSNRQQASNCHTLTALGLEEGFYLNFGVQKPNNSGGVYPPCLLVGGTAISRNSRPSEGCRYEKTPKGAFVRRADINRIIPKSGQPLMVLNDIDRAPKAHLLHIPSVHMLGYGKRLREDLESHHIFTGVRSSADVLAIGHGEALLRFSEPGEDALAFYPDGRVLKVVFDDFTLSLTELSPIDMAKERVRQAEDTLSLLGAGDLPKVHGVLWRAVNLIPFTRAVPLARLVVLDFLSEQSLTPKMRQRVREELSALGESTARFCDMQFGHRGGRTGPPASVVARKRNKAEKDREIRFAMQGTAGGGKSQSSNKNKKKGK